MFLAIALSHGQEERGHELSQKKSTRPLDQSLHVLILSVFTSLATRSNISRSLGLRPLYLPQLVLDPLMITS